jgi:hypothetical protein
VGTEVAAGIGLGVEAEGGVAVGAAALTIIVGLGVGVGAGEIGVAGVGAWVSGRDGRRVGVAAIAAVAIGVDSGALAAVGDPAVAPGSVRAEADTVAATCAVIVACMSEVDGIADVTVASASSDSVGGGPASPAQEASADRPTIEQTARTANAL